MDLLAQIISKIFGVATLLPAILLLVILTGPTPQGLLYPLLPILGFTNFFLPTGFFVYLIKTGRVSDWEATNVKERPLPYTFGLFCWFFGLIVTKFLGGPLLFHLMFAAFVLLASIVFITFFYKISVHATLNTAVFLLVNYLYNWKFWWAFPIILVVSWSRWRLKKHNWIQLAVGIILAAAVEIPLLWVVK